MSMKEILKKRKEWFVLFAMAAVVFGFCTYRITETTQPLAYPDEFGYWAASSFFVGQDWTSATSYIYYYSYGYGLLLVPIRLLENFVSFEWGQMFECAVLMHAIMLTGAFFIVRKLSIRYMRDMHWLVRDFACLAVMLYPSYIVYAHTTMTETALFFFFCVYLYVMMRMTDKSSVLNHICFALVSFYMYTIHQRCLAVVIAAVIIVVYMKLHRKNSLGQVTSFFTVMYLCSLVHSGIKQKLQNDFYMANEPAGMQEVIGYVFDKKALVLLAAICLCILALWLVEKGRARIVLITGIALVAVAVLYIGIHAGGIKEAAGAVDSRMATNDFAGQVWKVFDILTPQGFMRLLISCAGKWFYLASASGLMVCFGILGLGKHFLAMLWDGIKCLWAVLRGKPCQPKLLMAEQSGEEIWLSGMFLTWLGIFVLCAMYMMGIDRVDCLIYGRYHEFAAGFLFLYGFYELTHDRKWLLHTIVFVILYLVVGQTCQYLFNELQSAEFEPGHSIMFSRIFERYEVPYGKVWEVEKWSLGAFAVICTLVKLNVTKFRNANNTKSKKVKRTKTKQPTTKRFTRSGIIRFQNAETVRLVAALLVSCCFWGYMGKVIVDDFIIELCERVDGYMPDIAEGIDRLSEGEEIYFVKDDDDYRMGLVLQFNMPKESVTIIRASNMTWYEAFYVINTKYMYSHGVESNYSIVVETPVYTVLVPPKGELNNRLEKCGF